MFTIGPRTCLQSVCGCEKRRLRRMMGLAIHLNPHFCPSWPDHELTHLRPPGRRFRAGQLFSDRPGTGGQGAARPHTARRGNPVSALRAVLVTATRRKDRPPLGACLLGSVRRCQRSRLVLTSSLISSPRPLRMARSMNRLKPLACSALMAGGMASSCLAVCTSTSTGPG